MISFKQKNKGFTLVEMLISVGIFTVMSGIILANYPEFRSRSALDNLTAQVAIVFREAQVYGISVREQTTSFDTGYGVHIDLVTEKDGDKQLVIFADRNKNYIFDPEVSKTDGDTILETFRLNGGETITELCAPSCVGETGTKPAKIESVTAVFVRPNPDAYFSVGNIYDQALPSISLKVSNRSGSYSRYVEVYTTGQISVR